MEWTKEQQRVIDERDANILVSAAAGSGKTAVLVERILNRVMDKENPRDIDEFLVVTFTNAAAGQMRDKLASKLENALEKNPENEHLMRQMVLVNRADITTIDSFCLRIVKEYFSLLNMDSAFSIGDPGMMELMKNDVLDKLFERKYKEPDEDGEYMCFSSLVDIFCQDRDDDKLKAEILKIYNMASSYPVPEQWLSGAKAALMVDGAEELSGLPWVRKLIELVHCKINDAALLVARALELCKEDGGPDKNYEVSAADEEILNAILAADSYGSMHEAMSNISWTRLKTCKGDAYDGGLVAEYKKLRENYKKMVKSLDFFAQDEEKVVSQIKKMRTYLIPLIDLVSEFTDEYTKLKQSRKIMEFADVEHMAYRLVCAGYDDEGRPVPTDAGRKISEHYNEIFIDEYQDSNYLQEDILCSVSGISRGVYNMFMVGDVKQSIYRFRMARPDLFIDKYNSFKDEGNEIKIELRDNFRSRAVVLDAVNYFFYQLMGEDLGKIQYNKDIALKASKEFPEPEDSSVNVNTSSSAEIMIADSDIPEDDNENVGKLALEAEMIAGRIRELTDEESGMHVYDEERGEYRKAEFGDIVILARSVKGFGDIVYNTLTSNGIPVYLDDPKGYFDAVEIKVIMSLLSVVDNCRQDIPLAAVLLSPMADINENELALVCDYAAKNLKSAGCLYDKCLCYMEEYENDISDKLKRFMEIIETLKRYKLSMSISELIWKALDMTGYYLYASAMPMGSRRKANIDMLLEKADKYEDGYYKGLFNFLRYVEKLKVNEVDFGQANVLGDNENVVRIISMHKSKGLEYPIVFVSGLGRQFNRNDSRENIILHSDYYMSDMVFDNRRRYKSNSFIREAFKALLRNESMAEELRVLYVAMTRAKEKLILTGCESDVNGIMERQRSILKLDSRLLPYGIRQDSKSFMQLIMACMVRYNRDAGNVMTDAEAVIELNVCTYGDIIAQRVNSAVKKSVDIHSFFKMADEIVKDERYSELAKSFEFEYPYKAYTEIRSKMSISDIKKMKAYDGAGFEVSEITFQSERPAAAEGALSGAERGTLVHKFMELIEFSELADTDDYAEYVRSYKAYLYDRNIFDEDEIKAVNDTRIINMLKSDLGQRMIGAAARGELYKEQQFSVGIPASEIHNVADMPETADKADDVVIVQGIIDAFFYEDGELVLMDYKTDRADREELVGRYKAQLDYYAETLERLTGCIVKEKIIYSFYLNEEISLE